MKKNYNSYYPYTDEEFRIAMRHLVTNPDFAKLASFMFPGMPLDEARQRYLSYNTVREMQHDGMYSACQNVIDHYMSAFTWDGTEHLSPQQSYLYVSNHRDIVLDAMMLQYALVAAGHETSQITFGANLMKSTIMMLMGKSNKMFRVDRGGSPREFYASLMFTSQYMRRCVAEGKSVWIAQRNGRTKDGLDRTDPAIIKMFAMSGQRENPVQALADLHIVPMSVSYEWEPCGMEKAVEVVRSAQGPYRKASGEDTRSILTGIFAPKGRTHFSLCKPISVEEIQSVQGNPDQMAALMDSRINAAFRLWPNNYVAADLQDGTSDRADRYTPEDRQRFLAYLEQQLAAADQAAHDGGYSLDLEAVRRVLLGIYANPVKNRV